MTPLKVCIYTTGPVEEDPLRPADEEPQRAASRSTSGLSALSDRIRCAMPTPIAVRASASVVE
ncbi:hypothetical protein PCASD_02634, partial [Puccinia coronata f. sp. avenae]